MTQVTGYTSARMKEIEDSSIVNGVVTGDNLFLTRHNGATINAGNVRGPQGVAGQADGMSVIVASVESQPSWNVSNANNDAAINSAISVAVAAGGGNVLLPSLLKISNRFVVPNTVNLIGKGSYQGGGSSEIRCLTADSGVAFGLYDNGSTGGVCGGFYINGNNISNNPLFIGTRVGSTFINIDIWNGADGKHPVIVSNKVLTGNVVTLTSPTPHGYLVGDIIKVDGVDSPYNGTVVFDGKAVVATVPSATTLTYSRTHADVVSSAAVTGAVIMEWFDKNAAIKLENTQNCTFNEVNLQQNWINVICDKDAGTNTFIKCEMGQVKYKSLRFQQSDPTSGIWPLYNNWTEGCIFEYAGNVPFDNGSMFRHIVHHTAGQNNGIRNCLTSNIPPISKSNILIEQGDPYSYNNVSGGGISLSSLFLLDTTDILCSVQSGVAHIDVRVGGSIIIQGYCNFNGGEFIFRAGTNGGTIIVLGYPTDNGSGIKLMDEVGGIYTAYSSILRNPGYGLLQIISGIGGRDWLRVVNDDGLPGIRMAMNSYGQIAWSDGTQYVGDTFLYRKALKVLGTATDNCFQTGVCTTTTRPSASIVGAGSSIYDSTLEKTITSNGSVWKDAAGNVV